MLVSNEEISSCKVFSKWFWTVLSFASTLDISWCTVDWNPVNWSCNVVNLLSREEMLSCSWWMSVCKTLNLLSKSELVSSRIWPTFRRNMSSKNKIKCWGMLSWSRRSMVRRVSWWTPHVKTLSVTTELACGVNDMLRSASESAEATRAPLLLAPPRSAQQPVSQSGRTGVARSTHDCKLLDDLSSTFWRSILTNEKVTRIVRK